MPQKDRERRDALEGAPIPWETGEREPAGDLGMVGGGEEAPDVLSRRPGGRARQTPVRPSERRRRRRRLSVTFSQAGIPERIRDLALQWGLYAPDGQSPNVSAVVEYLLMRQLEAAETGQVAPPEEGD
jgi:hypothetical protein